MLWVSLICHFKSFCFLNALSSFNFIGGYRVGLHCDDGMVKASYAEHNKKNQDCLDFWV